MNRILKGSWEPMGRRKGRRKVSQVHRKAQSDKLQEIGSDRQMWLRIVITTST